MKTIRKKTTAKLMPMQTQYAWSSVSPVFLASHCTAAELRTGFASSPPFSLLFTSPVAGAGSRPGAWTCGVAEASCARAEEGMNIGVNISRARTALRIGLERQDFTSDLPRLPPDAIPAGSPGLPARWPAAPERPGRPERLFPARRAPALPSRLDRK